jgi:hypothetical protein
MNSGAVVSGFGHFKHMLGNHAAWHHREFTEMAANLPVSVKERACNS